MSMLLFKMRHVPQDEAEDIRRILDDNEIDFFETFSGNWGISVPAIWLKHDDQFEAARILIDDYQEERICRMRKNFHETKTMFQVFRESPSRFLIYLLAIAIVLFISFRFFFSF
ncbi:MAG: DUF6164 family protein [Gammaproteobacteria bacterium]|nr:DUF6164 family protein [Gammaproteobacteria bacterium]